MDAVNVEDLDAFDLFKRFDAFAYDAFDALQKLLAQPPGARRFRQYVLGLVELTGALGIDLVTFGGGEGANLFGFGRCLRRDLLRFCKASGGAHLRLGFGGNMESFALDLALRKDLGKYQPFIAGLELTDFRVRILNGGSGAVTRVLIESCDETGERWTTVGVSPNIIEASFQALMDSIVFKLVRSNAPA